MKTAQQRAAKRFKREKRQSKDSTWFCAGCNARHPNGERCPHPRLYAKSSRLVAHQGEPTAEHGIIQDFLKQAGLETKGR